MWWTTIIVVALLAFGIFGFVSMVRLFAQRLTSETTRGAEDMYDQYADSPRERHRRSLAPRRYWPFCLIECLTLHCGSPRARGAWPSAWPSPSSPLGRQRLQGQRRAEGASAHVISDQLTEAADVFARAVAATS